MCKINKNLLLIAITIWLCNEARAQKVWLGLHASPLMGWYKTESKNLKADGANLGFAYGLAADFRIGERYYIGSGFEISYMGGKLNAPLATYTNSLGVPSVITNTQMNYRLQYIQVPLTLKFRTRDIGNFAYWAQFGYSNSILMSGRVNLKNDNGVLNEEKLSVKDEEVKLNPGYGIANYRGSMIIALGVEYPIGGNSRLFTGLRFDNGIIDSMKDKALAANGSTLALNLGIYF